MTDRPTEDPSTFSPLARLFLWCDDPAKVTRLVYGIYAVCGLLVVVAEGGVLGDRGQARHAAVPVDPLQDAVPVGLAGGACGARSDVAGEVHRRFGPTELGLPRREHGGPVRGVDPGLRRSGRGRVGHGDDDTRHECRDNGRPDLSPTIHGRFNGTIPGPLELEFGT